LDRWRPSCASLFLSLSLFPYVSARAPLTSAPCSKHRVSTDRLAQLASSIPHVAIIHGTDDNLIHVDRAHELHKDLPVRISSLLCSVGTAAR